MTHRLEHARYVGDLSAAEYEAYVFDRRGTPVTVCWNALRAPFAARLPLGHGMMTLVDAMDNETRREVGADGLLAAPLGALPCYVEGGNWTAIRKAIAERPKDFLAGRGGNALGKNMARQRLPEGRLVRGRHFVSVAKDVPARYGETYVFANEGGKIGFYLGKAGTFAANKAFLDATDVHSVREFLGIDFSDEETAISKVEARQHDGTYYNLMGLPVVHPAKGIYLKNGKKYIKKN